MNFEDLNISKELLKGLYIEMGFSEPSKIQAITLPCFSHHHIRIWLLKPTMVPEKPTCFVFGMLSRVDPSKKILQAIRSKFQLICKCNREPSCTLEDGKYTGIASFCAIPIDSASYVPFKKCPPVTVQVVIGTPGTIKKWTFEKKLATRDAKILVFDEANHMLAEDGFSDDSLRIMKEIQRSSDGCQICLLDCIVMF